MYDATRTVILSDLFKIVWEEDSFVQESYVKMICEDIRHIPFQFVRDRQAIFIPNSDYLPFFLGDSVKMPELGLYDFNGMCKFTGRLIFPIYDLQGRILSIVGYDNDKEVAAFSKYMYQSSYQFKKTNHLFMGYRKYEKAVKDGYILIIDGIFDQVHLEGYGLNACSLMGSVVSPMQLAYLQFVKNKIVVHDNDNAGLELFESLNRKLRNVTSISQGSTWDIDDYLKIEGNSTKVIDLVRDMVSSGNYRNAYL